MSGGIMDIRLMWIDSKKNPPPYNKAILVLTDYSVFNIYIVTRFFNGKNWFWKVKESNVHIKDEEILHWMPLPNPMYYKKSK